MGEKEALQIKARDRISELPSHLRHHILSFLPTQDALRSSILSTTWRDDWIGIPCLKFDVAFFHQCWKFADFWTYIQAKEPNNELAKISEYFALLDRCLIRCGPAIQRLQLFLPAWDELHSSIASCINGLTVNDLDLDISWPCFGSYYHLPLSMLSGMSITRLSLYGVSLIGTSADAIQLPSLSDLSLTYVTIDSGVVENLIASCHATQDMCFSHCDGFNSLNIVGLPKLRKLEVLHNSGLESVRIDAPHLYSLKHYPHCKTPNSHLFLSLSCQSLSDLQLSSLRMAHNQVHICREQLLHLKKLAIFTYETDILKQIISWPSLTSLETLSISGCELDHVNITSYEKLTVLTLNCGITNDWLNRHLRLLAGLQVLTLKYCKTSACLKISSKNLKCLNIEGCKNLDHMVINCPSLSELRFHPKKNFASISFENALAPLSVGIDLIYGNGEGLSYVQLIGLLQNLRHSKYLHLHTNQLKNIAIPEELRQSNNSPLCHFEHLRLSLQGPWTVEDITSCVDSLLWLCHKLKTIHIGNCSTDHYRKLTELWGESEIDISLKFEYKEPMELDPTGCGCYDSLPINCWRHSLKDFKLFEHCRSSSNGSLRSFFEGAIIASRMTSG